MPAKGVTPSVTSARYAAIQALILEGVARPEICRRLKVSPRTVSRCSADVAGAAKAKLTAVTTGAEEGAACARSLAASRTPDAIRVILAIMDGPTEPTDSIRLAAAKTILDRGGVPVRTELDAVVSADPIRLARLAAMLSAKSE